MIGHKLFGAIDRRLRQSNPQGRSEFFGGLGIVLMGDFGQLSPVSDTPLYKNPTGATLANQGREAYLSIDKTYVLTQVYRQTLHLTLCLILA